MLDLGFSRTSRRSCGCTPPGARRRCSRRRCPADRPLAERYMSEPSEDPGDAEAAHRRRDRAGLRRGRAARKDRPADRGAAGRGARAGDHLLPDEDRRRAARRPARRPRPARQGASRRHEPGSARRGDDPVQGPQAAASGRHRRRRARARHRARHARHQLRHAEQHRDLRAPDRPHRPGRAHRARDHLRDPEAAREIPRIEREASTAIGEWEPPEERIEHAPRRGGAIIPPSRRRSRSAGVWPPRTWTAP